MKDKSYLYKLTPIEKEIFRLILKWDGKTAVIKPRGKSYGTISTQMSAIFQKKGVHSVKELRALQEVE